jgi:LysM repeat protein
MRRTLAALVLAITPPLTVLAVSGVQAQQVVTVRTGETLSEIAERHGVSLSRLMQANGISNPDHVEIGQRLTIPGSGSTARSTSSSSGSQGTAPYTVKSGETLSEIADRFNTTTARLIQINRISDPDLVMSGTRLQVPVTAQRSAPAASSAAVNRNASEHVVQSGENLSLIAERYGTSVSRLVALNQLEDPELVTAGTRLKLRGTPPAARSTPPAATKPKPAASTPAAQPAAAQQPAAQPQTAQQPTSQQAPVQQAAAQTAAATAQPSGSATTPATTTTAITPAAATAATTSTVTASTVTAAATTAATAAQPALTAARGATTAATSAATAATRSPLATATGAAATATMARATPAATTAATTSAMSRSASVSAARPAGEWRNYGPLQVDWSKIQPMGGSYVAPSLNGDGQPLYLAVNCTARKINVTSQAGQWSTWENPSKDFEFKLVQDICQATRS